VKSPRRFVLALATALVTLLALVGMVEVLSRATGHRPRVMVRRPEPTIHVRDPVLGWRPVPGRYEFGPYAPGGAPVTVTIRPDGARAAAADPPTGRPSLLLLGCSFTMGWAVSDAETWAWRVQELRPDLEVVNHGVAGYGTVQALLLLEALLRSDHPPRRVLYGDIGAELRNIASPMWLAMLTATGSTAATPYCTLGRDGRLERHPPAAYPTFPLHDRLASVAVLERAWANFRHGGREATAQSVTELVIAEMAERCRMAGVGFSLAILTLPDPVRRARLDFARARGIDVIDCDAKLAPSDSVPGEGHPNASAHRRWGDCIATALASRLPPP
jgi:hypothetical protein